MLRVRASGITTQTFETLIGPRDLFDWPVMWPKVRVLYWTTTQDYLQFLCHFLTLNVRYLEIHLEGAEDEEVQEVLDLVESRCMNLVGLHLLDPETRDNEEIQDTMRQIVYNNSLTLRTLNPPQNPSPELVSDILGLPLLQHLAMRVPQIPDRARRGILPSLEYLTFTLDEASDLINLLSNLRKSKLIVFSMTCPYPTSDSDHAALAYFFKYAGLSSSVDEFSWRPPVSGGPPTWQFVTTLKSFANLRTLSLGMDCDEGCRFEFRHHNVVELSRWMPRLRELTLGGPPCPVDPGTLNIEYHTLAILAKNCPDLFLLTIHFNPGTFGFVPPHLMEPNWNVTIWSVGSIGPPRGPIDTTLFAMAVSKLFPRATFLGTGGNPDERWKEIHEELQMLTLPADDGLLDLM